MSTICKYCNETENKQDRPGLICVTCVCFVHLSCLRRPGTPGDFTGDIFFTFTCEDCSPTANEIFERHKLQWVNVILLTLHHLNAHSYGISNKGYFHYKTHICSFIHRNWSLLFDINFKQKKNWIGTIAGMLSVYNKVLFRSGLDSLHEPGWWRLMHNFSAAVASHIAQELARDKTRWRPRNQFQLQNLFYDKVVELGYKDLIGTENDEFEDAEDSNEAEIVPAKRVKRSDSDELSGPSYLDSYNSIHVRKDLLVPTDERLQDNLFSGMSSKGYSDMDGLFTGVDFSSSMNMPRSESSSVHSMQQSLINYDSDSGSRSPRALPPDHLSDGSETHAQATTKRERDKTMTPLTRESLFSNELNSIDMPWLVTEVETKKAVVPLSEYEEIQLLTRVTSLLPKVADPNKKAYLRRFRAKLVTRRLKRHKHLPLFDLDKSVKILGGYVTEDPKTAVSTDRVLDRFQRSHELEALSGALCGRWPGAGAGMVAHVPAAAVRSPHSGALLKPYIRRQPATAPLWPRLMRQLLTKTNGAGYVHKDGWLEYSYVRPQHMPAINSLCEQFFWPGIDLSESLQYPEYSCVVTYKRLLVGFAFLVPDAGREEAYISFLLTRPEWRNAGIATFMLYHLLQTCSGKDVTLHVSPTNPAIFLYQKFGFKVEELIQDFYEKYYDIHHKGCRHALFLRLIR